MEPVLLCEPAAPPVVLVPVTQRERRLQALAPAVRRVAERAGPPDLLGAHQVGAAFNWIVDQQMYQRSGASPRGPEVMLVELCGGERSWKTTQLYQWGRIARYLEEPWVITATGRVSLDVAEVIVRPFRPRVRRPLAPWIRRLLLERAAETSMTAGAMRRVQESLRALALQQPAGPAPTEEEVRSRIEAALAAAGVAAAAGRGPREAARATLSAIGAQIEALGRELGRLPQLLIQVDAADPGVRQGAALLRMHVRDLDLRLGGMLSRFLEGAGDQRRVPRGPGGAEVGADEGGVGADEGGVVADAAGIGADEGGVGADEDGVEADEDGVEADEPKEDSAGAAAAPASGPALQVPAPPPTRRTPFLHYLTVPYPGEDPAPSPAERHACALLIAVARLIEDSEAAIAGAQRGDLVADRLALRVHDAAMAFACEIAEVRPDLEEGAEAGAALWQEERAAAPELPREALFPVPTAAGAAVPMAHVPFEVVDPLGDPEPTATERLLWRVLGLLSRARHELQHFHGRLMDHRDLAHDLLIFQLREALRDARFNTNRLVHAFQAGAQAARVAEAGTEAERAAVEEARRRAEARLLVLGSGRVPEQYAKIGVLEDGRPVALHTGRGLSLVALGGTGRGKSHLGVLLMESLLLPLPGLNRLVRRGVPVVFAADWRKGYTRHQHLSALEPNPDPRHLQWLRRHLHAELQAHLCAVPRVLALCLPGRRGAYEAAYADLRERGLEIREVRLHPEEWGSFGYGAMLGGLLGEKGATGRPQWASYLEQTAGGLGGQADPLRLWRDLERAGLGGRGRGAVRAVLERMAGLTSAGERIADVLEEDALVVFLLEDEHLGPEVILPLEAAIMNALTKGAPPDLPLLFVIEEVGKQGMNGQVQQFLEQMVREARHGLWSLFLGAHLSTDLPAATVTLAGGVAQLGGTSVLDVRRLGELRPEFAGLAARPLVEQPRGVATLGFGECSDPALAGQALQVILRPSCVHAGGETREVGQGD